jgi:hypothetical protein
MSDAPPIDTRAIRYQKAIDYHMAVKFTRGKK